MVRIPTKREPSHPGEVLLEDFLKPLNLTQGELAEAVQVPYQRINEIVNGKRGITASTALRLSRFLGTSVGFWMNLQARTDLYKVARAEAAELEKIRQHSAA